MDATKIMVVIYTVVTVLCAVTGITNISNGKTTNGILWFVASMCWLTCIFNEYRDKNSKK